MPASSAYLQTASRPAAPTSPYNHPTVSDQTPNTALVLTVFYVDTCAHLAAELLKTVVAETLGLSASAMGSLQIVLQGTNPHVQSTPADIATGLQQVTPSIISRPSTNSPFLDVSLALALPCGFSAAVSGE